MSQYIWQDYLEEPAYWPEFSQLCPARASSVCCLFLCGPWAQNGFHFYKRLKNSKEEKYSLASKYYMKFMVQCSMNNVSLEHSYAHLFKYYLWLLPHNNGRVKWWWQRRHGLQSLRYSLSSSKKKFTGLCFRPLWSISPLYWINIQNWPAHLTSSEETVHCTDSFIRNWKVE